jgi:ABC-type phosphate/phosphonate transport system ATPase subunit
MVGKLASMTFMRSDDLPPGEIGRDEIRQVIADAVILAESDDPAAMLDEWMAA